MRKLAGRPAPQYLVYVGGGIARRPRRFRPPRRQGAGAPRRAPTLERLLDFYIAARRAPATRSGPSVALDTLRALIADLADLPDAAATDADFVDLGDDTRVRGRDRRRRVRGVTA